MRYNLSKGIPRFKCASCSKNADGILEKDAGRLPLTFMNGMSKIDDNR